VLRGVNLRVGRGEAVVLLGRTGVGKTTLCMTLNGLVPQATGGVIRGDVIVLGQDARRHPVADLARQVGLVFQDPESQLFHLRVEDEVAFGPENLGLPPNEIEKRVNWALAAVGLIGMRDRSPLRLSGGQKQRLAIAAVLAMHPQVLVLDEPTSSLDPVGKAEVIAVLDRLRQESQLTLVAATQELEWAAEAAGRVIVLDNGRLVMDGSPEEVFSQVEMLRAIGVGAPQMAELAHALQRRSGREYHFTRLDAAEATLTAELQLDSRRVVQANGGRKSKDAQEVVHVPSTGEGSPLIAVEGVHFAYPDGTVALQGVDMTIYPGERVALLGSNGAGKTTLAKHCNGLLRPNLGKVWVNGENAVRQSVSQLAAVVGYAFQNPDHQIFAPTVWEEIAFGPRNLGLSATQVQQRVDEALARFRLERYTQVPPAVLGFGLRRKVALAAITAQRPRLLVLDEPTGGLDRRSARELLAAVAELNQAGTAVMLITHDMRLVAEWADRAVVLVDGQVRFDGSPRRLFASADVLQAAELRPPPVMMLAQRLRAFGMPSDVLTVDEFVAAYVSRTRQHIGDSQRATSNE